MKKTQNNKIEYHLAYDQGLEDALKATKVSDRRTTFPSEIQKKGYIAGWKCGIDTRNIAKK